MKKLCTSLSVSIVYLKTCIKVCDTTKAGNSINKHKIQLLASMTYVSFIEKIVKDVSFQTRDEKDAL